MAKFNNENKITAIMLVGSSHCGSTLLNLIFDSHSQITGVGKLIQYQSKLPLIERGLCGCGKKLKECGFWQKAFSGLEPNELRRFCEKGIDFLFRRNYFYADRQEKFDADKYARLTGQVYRNALEYSGKKIIFDSSKVPDRAEVLIRNPDLNIVLLHLVRDGRGVTYSNIKRGRPALPFMKRWAISNIKTEIVKLRNRKTQNIFVRYEDFVKDPERILKYILKEVELDFEPAMLNFGEKIHHLVGNYSLLFVRKDDRIKPDVEWRDKMPLKDKILFNILFGWLNVFYKLKPKKY